MSLRVQRVKRRYQLIYNNHICFFFKCEVNIRCLCILTNNQNNPNCVKLNILPVIGMSDSYLDVTI